MAFRLAGNDAFDESDIAWQLSAERGWMVPAYTSPERREGEDHACAGQGDDESRAGRAADQDLADACATLDEKGATSDVEREQTKMGTGY